MAPGQRQELTDRHALLRPSTPAPMPPSECRSVELLERVLGVDPALEALLVLSPAGIAVPRPVALAAVAEHIDGDGPCHQATVPTSGAWINAVLSSWGWNGAF